MTCIVGLLVCVCTCAGSVHASWIAVIIELVYNESNYVCELCLQTYDLTMWFYVMPCEGVA